MSHAEFDIHAAKLENATGIDYMSESVPQTSTKVLIVTNFRVPYPSPQIRDGFRRVASAIQGRFRPVTGKVSIIRKGEPENTTPASLQGLAVLLEVDYWPDEKKASILLKILAVPDPLAHIKVGRNIKKDGKEVDMSSELKTTRFPPIPLNDFNKSAASLEELKITFSFCIRCFDEGCTTCLSGTNGIDSASKMGKFIADTSADPDSGAANITPLQPSPQSLNPNAATASYQKKIDTPGASGQLDDIFPPSPPLSPTSIPQLLSSGLSLPTSSTTLVTSPPTIILYPPAAPPRPPPHPRTVPMDHFSRPDSVPYCIFCLGSNCPICLRVPIHQMPPRSEWYLNFLAPNNGPDYMCVVCGGNGTCELCARNILPFHQREMER
ncbi:hypothetical protein K504DRAFT_101944 [Pleomassaria siparia CBS 279.74]|uniref:Uncharacterized protein n=1 Tax=Pleomassaria siparia CBS 279.74 TaxID=1314801 RepID=A0A6G1JXZ4_9PLEO|nr:hypothetical protein K504DRAFT_101944 [Pleomassaria siparia CBS 279.74]